MHKYKVEDDFFFLENYHKEQPAKFKLYSQCAICDIIRRGEKWEPHLHVVFEKYLDENSVVIEGGCHIGTHSVKLSKLSKRVLCFEPLPPSYNLLVENLRINGCDNVDAHPKGLAERKSFGRFSWITTSNAGASGLCENPMGEMHCRVPDDENFDVELISIDDMNLDQLDFIKLDVEGYESKVIKGAIETINRFKPTILLECWVDHTGKASVEHTEKTFKFLLNMNYSLERISHADWLFVKS